MSTPMIELRDIEKRYGEVTALERTRLAVHKGEFMTLLGPSGSGKTTLLNLMAGTTAPSSGRLFLDGEDMTDAPTSARQLGMVFQNYALLPHLSVFENIAFPLRVRKAPEADIKRKVADILTLIELPDVADRKPKALSGGQQQRIAIARCLVYGPKLILMDEPLGALDRNLRGKLQFEIKNLHARLGMTIVYVTHDQGEALAMSDRVCLMRKGRIEQLGSADDLYFRPKTVFAAEFVGDSNILAACRHRDTELALSIPGLSGTTALGGPEGKTQVMVRPENVTVTAAEGADTVGYAARFGHHTFSASGKLEDIVLAGSSVMLRVKLDSGQDLICNRLTTLNYREMTVGMAVNVSFDDDAIVEVQP